MIDKKWNKSRKLENVLFPSLACPLEIACNSFILSQAIWRPIIDRHFCLNIPIWQLSQSSNFNHRNSDSKTFFVTGVFINLVKNLPTVNSAVRARVRASWWCSQAAKPHLGKIVPTYKAACRLYFASNVDAKNIIEMPRKLPFKWCYLWLEMLLQNVHISPQTLGTVGHQISHFRLSR